MRTCLTDIGGSADDKREGLYLRLLAEVFKQAQKMVVEMAHAELPAPHKYGSDAELAAAWHAYLHKNEQRNRKRLYRDAIVRVTAVLMLN